MVTKNMNSLGILACMASTAGYVINEMFIKLASSTIPLGESILIRSIIAFLLVGIIVLHRHGINSLKVIRYGAIRIRILCEVAGTVLYLSALLNMPFANASALLQTAPLLVVVGSVLYFRERIGWRRWIAVSIGLLGTLLIIRPGMQGFDGWSLMAFAAAFCLAIRELATKKIPAGIPTYSVALLTTIGVGLLGVLMYPFEDWQPVDSIALGYLAASAIFILLGYVTIIWAVKVCELAVIAPFYYSTIIWAILTGFFVWNEIPDFPTTVGILILVGTGLYNFMCERKLHSDGNKN